MVNLNFLSVGLIFILLSFDLPVGEFQSRTCNELKVEVTVRPGEVEFTVENAVKPIKYYVVNEKKKLISEDQSVIRNMKKGSYEYMVIDSNGCWKKGDLKVTNR